MKVPARIFVREENLGSCFISPPPISEPVAEYLHVDHSKKLLNDRLEMIAHETEVGMYDETGRSQLNASEAYTNYLKRRFASIVRSFKLEIP